MLYNELQEQYFISLIFQTTFWGVEKMSQIQSTDAQIMKNRAAIVRILENQKLVRQQQRKQKKMDKIRRQLLQKQLRQFIRYKNGLQSNISTEPSSSIINLQSNLQYNKKPDESSLNLPRTISDQIVQEEQRSLIQNKEKQEELSRQIICNNPLKLQKLQQNKQFKQQRDIILKYGVGVIVLQIGLQVLLYKVAAATPKHLAQMFRQILVFL